MDSDSDEEKREKELPPYRVRYNDMPVKLVKEVVRCNEKSIFYSFYDIFNENRLKWGFHQIRFGKRCSNRDREGGKGFPELQNW